LDEDKLAAENYRLVDEIFAATEMNAEKNHLEDQQCDETFDPLLDQGLVEVWGRCYYLLLLLKR
jgi:hypothetical protein